MPRLNQLSSEVRQYLIVTANYWAFTLTDGALRMLVILYFHGLGYSPLQIAMLFLFYEIFGVITNLVGGWLGSLLGLNRTMNIGLFTQLIALTMLLVPASWLTIIWVMAAQALSGIAKDLNKMSAKSAIKLLVPSNAEGKLYKWVALLTGSKNTLKGVGFFLGGVLLSTIGFQGAVLLMLLALMCVWLCSLLLLRDDLGKASNKPKFSHIFSNSRAVNILAAARLFLFAARDVWFVISLPVYLASNFGWDHWSVSGALALWVIGYGVVQTLAPKLTRRQDKATPDGRSAVLWAAVLALIPALIGLAVANNFHTGLSLFFGLLIFGIVFAINSSLHSYLIISYARSDGVSLDVGFYYMANALGRLLGTVLSGWVYQVYGLSACLWISTLFVILAALISIGLPHQNSSIQKKIKADF